MNRRRASDSGQTIVEFVLILSATLGIATLLANAFFRMRQAVYMKMLCEVTSACPGCPPLEEVRQIANRAVPNSCR